jgi:nicotinate-nucleotide adenylyltransferase
MAARIGIYGGSFDPVHNAHLLVAQAAIEELQLDRLIFVPAAQSPFKPESAPAPAKQRLGLLRLALAGHPELSIDDTEIRRGGVSYTIDTVRELQGRHLGAELCYLIGADHVASLPKWKAAEELANSIQFVMVPRPGLPSVAWPPPFRGVALRGFPMGVSSSEIRDRVRTGKRIDLLVPPAVAEAITNNRLYL